MWSAGIELPSGLADQSFTVRSLLKAFMPQISRFLGIVVAIYYRDHNPPHFHAKYGEHEVVVYIGNGVVQGRFPRRALTHVLEWYAFNQQELLEDWHLAQQRKPLQPIDPLE